MNISDFVSPIEVHKILNPKLWAGPDLRPDVHNALLTISAQFFDFLNMPVEVEDIIISGSQANYNYSPYSDLDLHFVVDYAGVKCDMEVDELFDTKRKLWKEQHNIKIHGIPVELYVEDKMQPAVSSVYSLLSRKWLKKPNPQAVIWDKHQVGDEVKKWTSFIDTAVNSNNLEVCRRVKEMLSIYRKDGLAKGGEFSVPNLAFKSLRNAGKVQELMDKIGELFDRQLSI
jgi:hypothetical protein